MTGEAENFANEKKSIENFVDKIGERRKCFQFFIFFFFSFVVESRVEAATLKMAIMKRFSI